MSSDKKHTKRIIKGLYETYSHHDSVKIMYEECKKMETEIGQLKSYIHELEDKQGGRDEIAGLRLHNEEMQRLLDNILDYTAAKSYRDQLRAQCKIVKDLRLENQRLKLELQKHRLKYI